MSKRSQARELASMIETNITGKMPAGDQIRHTTSEKIVRTTLSAPSSVVFELRQLALIDRCHMNDLILIAIGDFLRSVGRDREVPVNSAVRERINARRLPTCSDIDHIQGGTLARQSPK